MAAKKSGGSIKGATSLQAEHEGIVETRLGQRICRLHAARCTLEDASKQTSSVCATILEPFGSLQEEQQTICAGNFQGSRDRPKSRGKTKKGPHRAKFSRKTIFSSSPFVVFTPRCGKTSEGTSEFCARFTRIYYLFLREKIVHFGGAAQVFVSSPLTGGEGMILSRDFDTRFLRCSSSLS